MQAELFLELDCELGEGIQWNVNLQRLFWTDIHDATLWSCDANGQNLHRLDLPERLCAFCFDGANNLLGAFESGLFRCALDNPVFERLTYFEPNNPSTRYNDGRCDRQGSFIAGGVNEANLAATSSVTRYSAGKTTSILTNVGCANSICFSRDGEWMYFADSPTGVIKRFRYRPDEAILEDESVFFETDDHGVPDGSCVDANENVWNARFNGSSVLCIDSTGQLAEQVIVDAPQVTCVCFGGPNMDRLYITTARENMRPVDIQDAPLSGSLFVYEPDSTGVEETRFGTMLF